MTQKEIKAKYMEIICAEVWPSSKRMQEYASKEFYYGVELDNGDIYVIDKPRIKKDFCFGYGMNGVSLEGDDECASEMARHARTSEEYFIDRNLDEINSKLDALLDPRKMGYKYLAYYGQQSGSKLKTFTMINPYDFDRMEGRMDVEELSQAEMTSIINGYLEVRHMFTKRLKTYLKRYGLTKLNVWTYLRD